MKLLDKIKLFVMMKSRGGKIGQFYSLCDHPIPILDVGVSSNEHNVTVNPLLNAFKYPDNFYTGLAVQSMDALKIKHPGKKFVQYPGDKFPFDNGSFGWCFSNAVVEHVGSKSKQLSFINEMMRVGGNVFFTTPNRFFPIESHTNALLLHWFPDSIFFSWCKEYAPFWTTDNLCLLSYSSLKSLMENSNAAEFKIIKNRVLGWPMTFTVICRGK